MAKEEEKVTRIKAKDEGKVAPEKNKKVAKKGAGKKVKPAKKVVVKKEKREVPKFWRVVRAPFYYTIWRVMKPVGWYIGESWGELRQVRWTNRKTTWKLTLAVVVYTMIFFLFIMALDALFSLLFNKVIG